MWHVSDVAVCVFRTSTRNWWNHTSVQTALCVSMVHPIEWRYRCCRRIAFYYRFCWLPLIVRNTLPYFIISGVERYINILAFRSDAFGKNMPSNNAEADETKSSIQFNQLSWRWMYRQVFGTIQSIAWRDEELYGKLQFWYYKLRRVPVLVLRRAKSHAIQLGNKFL